MALTKPAGVFLQLVAACLLLLSFIAYVAGAWGWAMFWFVMGGSALIVGGRPARRRS